MPRIVELMAVAALVTAAGGCAHATPANTIPSYTATQAKAGERAYQAACSPCHDADLSGAGAAPALAGPPFARRWDGHPVSELTAFMHEHMPRTVPGVLNDRTYVAVASYLLSMNGVRTGQTPLTIESVWTIRMWSR